MSRDKIDDILANCDVNALGKMDPAKILPGLPTLGIPDGDVAFQLLIHWGLMGSEQTKFPLAKMTSACPFHGGNSVNIPYPISNASVRSILLIQAVKPDSDPSEWPMLKVFDEALVCLMDLRKINQQPDLPNSPLFRRIIAATVKPWHEALVRALDDSLPLSQREKAALIIAHYIGAGHRWPIDNDLDTALTLLPPPERLAMICGSLPQLSTVPRAMQIETRMGEMICGLLDQKYALPNAKKDQVLLRFPVVAAHLRHRQLAQRPVIQSLPRLRS